MAKVFVPCSRMKRETSVLGKRKLDFDYRGFMKRTQSSPLISPNIGKKSGVLGRERDGRK